MLAQGLLVEQPQKRKQKACWLTALPGGSLERLGLGAHCLMALPQGRAVGPALGLKAWCWMALPRGTALEALVVEGHLLDWLRSHQTQQDLAEREVSHYEQPAHELASSPFCG